MQDSDGRKGVETCKDRTIALNDETIELCYRSQGFSFGDFEILDLGILEF